MSRKYREAAFAAGWEVMHKFFLDVQVEIRASALLLVERRYCR